ncbi:MAG: DUF3592 domain-containing protein [Alphaproteobacteria bacterium]|nr:DUF3592 domain-containing protein [Alphaproteobacteria bacterium]
MSTVIKTVLSKSSGCFPLVFFVFSLPFLGIGSYEIYKEVMLKIEGQVTVAKVIGKESDSRSSSGNSSTTYHVEYEFETETGITIKDDCQISGDAWRDIDAGMNISVLYSTSNPSISRMVGESYLGFAIIFFGLGFVFSGGALTFIVRAIRKQKMKERLINNGLTIKAKVVKIERAGDFNEEPYSVLFYSFTSPIDGTKIDGKSCWIPSGKLEHYKEAGEIKVFYNPDNPKQNFWAEENRLSMDNDFI